MYTHCIYFAKNTMKGSIRKWGNSLALRIPKGLAEEARLKPGSEVDMTVAEGAVVVRAITRAPLTLASLLKAVTPANLHGERAWGDAAGREEP
jgi:antitoxin MazE